MQRGDAGTVSLAREFLADVVEENRYAGERQTCSDVGSYPVGAHPVEEGRDDAVDQPIDPANALDSNLSHLTRLDEPSRITRAWSVAPDSRPWVPGHRSRRINRSTSRTGPTPIVGSGPLWSAIVQTSVSRLAATRRVMCLPTTRSAVASRAARATTNPPSIAATTQVASSVA